MAFLNDLFKKNDAIKTSNFSEEVDKFIVFIREKVSKRGLTTVLDMRTKKISQSNEAYKKANLAGLYLSFEQYLLSINLLKTQEVNEFRKLVKSKFPLLLESRDYAIIFLSEMAREYILSVLFIMKVLEKAQKIVGKSADNYLKKSYDNLNGSITEVFKYKVKIKTAMQESVTAYSQEIYAKLSEKFGEGLISTFYKDSYYEMSENFQMLEGFTTILTLFPEKILDEQQINLLNSEEVKDLLFEKIGSLQYANQLLNIEVKERKNAQKELKKREERIGKLNEKLEGNVEKLNSANNELESFSYSVGHDLRAPLRAINGFSKILKNDYGDVLDDEGNRLLEIITTNSKKMGRLIDDLLTYSQLSRKSIVINNINSANVIKEYLYENKIEERRVIIKELHNMKADKMLMKLVFGNLIENAIKFSSHKKLPRIEVGSKENGKYLEFYVKDNGVGFEMEYVHKLFGVFEKLHPDEEFTGTGVGLAITEKIISKHKGKVWAESKSNEGATFYFSIPK